ncbi:hypothetical protein DL93DRAFT_2086285, partial [Clavulina sp. PMI_390]
MSLTRGPVGEEFIECARLDDGTRKDVRANLGSFLKHHDSQFPPIALLSLELLQTNCRRKARRTTANDAHIDIISISLNSSWVVQLGPARTIR